MPELDFERRVAAALRAPVDMRDGARERIMHRVRDAARITAPGRNSWPQASRSARHSLVGLAMAASIGSVAVLSAVVPRPGRSGVEQTGVIGDSVVATLRDTLRLVRLIFDDPGARRVAVVGDFNDWQASATPLRREGSSSRWAAVVALRDGDHRYAFVVDGARWVPDPASAPVHEPGRVISLLHVARASN